MCSGELISSVVSDQFSEHVHGEIFGVLVGGGVEEDSDVQIGHFVISHIEGRGGEVGFSRVGLFGLSGGELAEGLVDHRGNFFVFDITGGGDHEV